MVLPLVLHPDPDPAIISVQQFMVIHFDAWHSFEVLADISRGGIKGKSSYLRLYRILIIKCVSTWDCI